MNDINLQEIGRKIYVANGRPNDLDKLLVELSGWYSFYSDIFITLELAEAKFFQDMKGSGETKLSDKMVDSLWKISEEGSEHIRVKQTIRTVEKLMSNIKASLRRAEIESRNL